jgi:hypothetical protein
MNEIGSAFVIATAFMLFFIPLVPAHRITGRREREKMAATTTKESEQNEKSLSFLFSLHFCTGEEREENFACFRLLHLCVSLPFS